MHYLYLTLAIVLEVLATALLGKSEGFTKWLFAVGSLLSYGVCFYFLSLALKNIPLGVAYAIWSGVGIVLTAIVSILVFKNKIDLPFVLGSLLIIAGVVVINLFSKTNGHWLNRFLTDRERNQLFESAGVHWDWWLGYSYCCLLIVLLILEEEAGKKAQKHKC